MISRIVMALALMAGTVTVHGAAQAQTDNSSSPSATMAPAGGSPANTPAMTTSVTKTSQPATSPGTVSAKGGKATYRGRGTDVAERQMTACLNTAAAQGSSMDSCKR